MFIVESQNVLFIILSLKSKLLNLYNLFQINFDCLKNHLVQWSLLFSICLEKTARIFFKRFGSFLNPAWKTIQAKLSLCQT